MTSSNIKTISDRVIAAFADHEKPIGLHEPEFSDSAWLYVKECLDTGWVSSAGKYVEKFAEILSAYTKLHAVPVMNGTAALHLCLYMAEVTQGQEVLIPSLTFVATANAVSYLGATPHFIDCKPSCFSLDLDKLEQHLTNNFSKSDRGSINNKTGNLCRALIVTHIFGHIHEMERLHALCKDFNLQLIEDAAEALGSFYDGKHAGHFGVLSALSFNGNKIVTTGGGGAILTHNKDLAMRAQHLSTTAKTFDAYMSMHDELGYNYRMPNINAALGCSQLESLPSALIRKKALADRYALLFADLEDAKFLRAPENCESNYWLNALILSDKETRNALIDMLMVHGIQTRGVWTPMHQLPMYSEVQRMDCSNAQNLAARTINLPSSAFLHIT